MENADATAAAQDLEEIWQYIAAQSPTYASGMIDQIVQAAENLDVFPRMGPELAGIARKGIEVRQWIVRPYRIVYRVLPDRVIVAAIVHGARSIKKAMRGRPLQQG